LPEPTQLPSLLTACTVTVEDRRRHEGHQPTTYVLYGANLDAAMATAVAHHIAYRNEDHDPRTGEPCDPDVHPVLRHIGGQPATFIGTPAPDAPYNWTDLRPAAFTFDPLTSVQRTHYVVWRGYGLKATEPERGQVYVETALAMANDRPAGTDSQLAQGWIPCIMSDLFGLAEHHGFDRNDLIMAAFKMYAEGN
jgi:hypothetical protein